MIWDTKGGNFYTVPRRLVSPKSSTIPNLEKSLLCKVRSLTRVLFDIEAHNFVWDEDLKKKDGEALTLGDICTFCFFVVGFLFVAFFAQADSQDDFLMARGGDGRDSKEDMNSLFSTSFQFEFELSSINY